jgi:hypothetical protein
MLIVEPVHAGLWHAKALSAKRDAEALIIGLPGVSLAT